MSDLNDATVDSAFAAHCKNCDAPLAVFTDGKPGGFCPRCGQDTHNHPPTFFEFVHEFITHYVALEGKLWKTLLLLFFKPAELTREYRAGRKLRYISPLRLYITASFLFFFIVKIIGAGSFMQNDIDDPATLRQTASEVTREFEDAAQEVKSEFGSAAQADNKLVKEGAEDTKNGIKITIKDGAADAKTNASPSPEKKAAEKDQADHDQKGGWQNYKWTWSDGADQKAAINVPCRPNSTLCPLLKNRLQEKFKDKTNAQVLDDLKRGMIANVPYVLFLMLPLFAALTKLLYFRRGLYYGEHVVYALHIHAFTFFGLLISALVPDFLTGWIVGLIAIYYLVAMKRYFAGGWFMTIFRYGVIATVYPVLLSFAAMLIMIGVLIF